MQNPEKKTNYKLGLIVFLGIASFIIAAGGLPILLFLGIWAISFVPKINKLLKQNGYKISDIFSKDGGMIITLILENFKKEIKKTQDNLNKIKDNNVGFNNDETINELEINELEQNDELFNYKNSDSKALDNNGYDLKLGYNDTVDIGKIIKKIIIGSVIIAVLSILIFLPEWGDLFNIDISRNKETLENIFLSNSLISRIVLAIIVSLIIFKISRDYYNKQ